jgi:hypothetical protein
MEKSGDKGREERVENTGEKSGRQPSAKNILR